MDKNTELKAGPMLILKNMWCWISNHIDIIFSAYFAGIALVSWNALSILFLYLAILHYRHHAREVVMAQQRDLIKSLYERNILSVLCVDELTSRLLPLVKDDDAIHAILRKYDLDWEKSRKKYHDKWPPGPPNKPKTEEKIATLKPATAEGLI